jgi:hypothetical protein
MRDGEVVGRRAKLNLHFSHLVLDNVSEGDEGVYTLKNAATPEDIRRIRLIVRGTLLTRLKGEWGPASHALMTYGLEGAFILKAFIYRLETSIVSEDILLPSFAAHESSGG